MTEKAEARSCSFLTSTTSALTLVFSWCLMLLYSLPLESKNAPSLEVLYNFYIGRKTNKMWLVCCIHLSVHFLYPLNPSVGSRGGWSFSQRSSGERQGTPWTGRQSITGPHRDTQPCTLTPKDNLETPINLSCMLLDGGRKPEYPGRTPHRKAPAGDWTC